MIFYRKYFVISFFLVLCLFFSCNDVTDKKSLLVYCAAGMKPVLQEVAKQYEQKQNVRIDIQYGGSGTLLSNLRIAKKGDLYLAADYSYIKEAKRFGLIAETQPLAYLQPVLVAHKNYIKPFQNLSDLWRKKTTLALANPSAASVGKLTKKIFTSLQKWDSLQSNIKVLMPTVSEVANALKLKTVEMGIIWDATAHQYKDLKIIDNNIFNAYQKTVTIGVLCFTRQPTEALKFLRYLSASDRGLKIFKRFGYRIINGDVWAEKPRLLFYSGGVNRLAVDEIINNFEKREGVLVDRVYNGCGILVSQIKSGAKPDVYLSCDRSFMTNVSDDFRNITDISSTPIIIATQKNNPKKITTLKDLTKKNIKIGVCNENQSALGALTKKILKQQNLWKPIYKNIRSQTPTADLLVNQLRTGSLDAVIVYGANVATVIDKIHTIYLSEKSAVAFQNFGINKKTKYPFLIKRLLHFLTTEKAKENYLQNGFQWNYKLK